MGRIVQFPNVVRQARPAAAQHVALTAKDVQNAELLAQGLTAMARVVEALQRAVAPPFAEFEDVACPGGGAQIVLPHGLGCRVRWWVTDWTCTAASAPILRRLGEPHPTTLTLLSNQAGTATIRVEATS